MASLKRCCVLALFFIICQMLLLIQTLPLKAEGLPQDVTKGQAGREIDAAETAGGMEGIATYYAKRYNGRKTRSGERYRPDRLTAAHPTLPMGTMVRVINLDNENEVVVKINDRCRERDIPNIDLSRAAAAKLGFLGKGTASVLMEALDEEPS